MHTQTSQPPCYVFDSSSLIELERSHDLRHLSPPGNFLIVPSRVAKEVNKRGSPLATWLKKGRVAMFVATSEHELFYRLTLQAQGLSDADIQGIVITHHRRGKYVVEENAARRMAENLGLSCLSAKEFLSEFLPKQLSFL